MENKFRVHGVVWSCERQWATSSGALARPLLIFNEDIFVQLDHIVDVHGRSVCRAGTVRVACFIVKRENPLVQIDFADRSCDHPIFHAILMAIRVADRNEINDRYRRDSVIIGTDYGTWHLTPILLRVPELYRGHEGWGQVDDGGGIEGGCVIEKEWGYKVD